jgi:hypothetical protein
LSKRKSYCFFIGDNPFLKIFSAAFRIVLLLRQSAFESHDASGAIPKQPKTPIVLSEASGLDFPLPSLHETSLHPVIPAGFYFPE